MASFKINDDEFDRLVGERPIAWVVYLAIRRHMDFETGIAGIERRFSDQYFLDLLRVKKIGGRAKQEITRTALRNAIKRLEKIGLLERRCKHIFRCILADSDQSVSRRWVGGQTEVGTEVGTSQPTNNSLINNGITGKKKRGQSEVSQSTVRGQAHFRGTGNTPGFSNLEFYNSLPDDNPITTDTLSKIPKNKFSTPALEVLNYIRHKTGRKFGADDRHTKLIVARLKDKESPTVDDCKLVIDSKWAEWEGNDAMASTIKQLPTALFRPSNFYRYLDAAREGGGDGDEDTYEAFVKRQEERAKNGG